jgi:RNA recognition motif-containing protein
MFFLANDQEGRFAGFANVIYTNSEDASACVNYGKTIGAQIGGRRSLLYLLEDAREEPLPRYGTARPVKQLSPQSRTLFISNLSFEADAKDLQETFGAFGQIERLSLRKYIFNLEQKFLN